MYSLQIVKNKLVSIIAAFVVCRTEYPMLLLLLILVQI